MVDTQVQNLTALTTASDEDVLYIVDDPAGTPLSRKITKANLLKALGTPDSGTLTNCTGLPITGITSSTSAQLKTLISDETGSGSLVFATSPTLVTPALGTPSSGTLTNCTGLPITGITSTTSSELKTLISDETGSGALCFATSPTLVTPVLGTPSSGTLTNCVGYRETWAFACSDETTALTTGTGKVEFQMPYAFTVTDVMATVTTAATGGTLLTVDINEGGTSILSTKITLDASEKTSRTAATPAVISDSSLANNAVMTIDIDAVGSTIAGAGLKVYIIGYQS